MKFVMTHEQFKNKNPQVFQSMVDRLGEEESDKHWTAFGELQNGTPFFVHDNGCYYEIVVFSNGKLIDVTCLFNNTEIFPEDKEAWDTGLRGYDLEEAYGEAEDAIADDMGDR